MIKRIITNVIIVIMLALTLIGCDGQTPNVDNIEVKSSQPSITINIDEVETFDYTSLFTITKNGENITVLKNYLDLSTLRSEVGSYILTCTYNQKIATIIIVVEAKQTISINTTVEEIEVDNIEVLTHDYKQYFNINDGGLEVTVLDDYLDLSKLRTTAGTYVITCSYKGSAKTLSVKVNEVSYQLKLSSREISIKQSEVENYDFKSLFTAVVNGKIIQITDSMVKSNVESNVGEYQYTVTLGESSMTLKVYVISDHEVEIINSYNLFEIEESAVASFDFTNLFTVYVDGEVREVKNEMIDKTSLNEANTDNIYEIKIQYVEGQAVGIASCYIKVIPDKETVVTTKNIVTYPNGEHIDLTTLFEIKKGSEIIPVTIDMISGTVNNALVGINVITLTYNGETYESTVEVKQGVIINFAKSNVVSISKGTSKSSYEFKKDFIVLINGIRFTEVEKYINTENVDFSVAGTYTATIQIPYKDSSLGYTEVTYFTEEITYEVVDVTYDIKVSKELVELSKGTTEYNAFDNLIVKVNGVNQKLVKSASAVSVLATYAVVTSEPIDFSYIGVQQVTVDVYVFGPSNEPVTVTFNVIVKSDINIEFQDILIFEGDSIYTVDLFKITYNDEEIEVTQEMIEGKVDTLTPGIYPVTINYEGIMHTAQVIVLNKDMAGTYKTRLTTIPVSGSTDEDGYEESGVSARELKNLYITTDGQISVDGMLATILYGIDENSIYIKIGSYEFTLYYSDGIIVIDPNNSIKLSYADIKRPYIYFKEDMWEIEDKVTINSTENHILEHIVNGYTLDVFKIKSLETNESIWYGLMIDLYEKMNSDTNYLVTHGIAVFDESWQREAGTHSSVEYNGKVYEFNMVDSNTAKIGLESSSTTYKYANVTFTGVFNNEVATLSVDMYEGYLLKVNDVVVLNVSGSSVRNQKYGGVDYSKDEVLIISEGSVTSAPYSYKFILDLENETFTYVEKDLLFGRYSSSSMMLFFDGYGSGLINFDTKQYGLTKFQYEQIGNEIEITFIDTKPTFVHGDTASLYVDALYTTLTAKYFKDEEIRGVKFINNFISDGAIIEISSYTLKTYTSAVLGRKALFDLIKIILPTGELTDNATKIKIIDISDINFAVSGFYHFSITCTVGGNDVVMHYTLQIS